MSITDLQEHDFRPLKAADAARRFGAKAVLTSKEFDRLHEDMRKHAFRIARVHNLALVQEARDVVHRGIRDGTPYDEIRRDLQDLFDRRGLPKPSLGHLMTIWRRNSLQAYHDAREDRLRKPKAKEIFPFWRYVTVSPTGTAGGILNVRATHAALHNKVFLVDDPFWITHRPPWEWG